MTEPLESVYFSWLCGKVLRVEFPTPSLTYWNLFRKLYDTEYVYLLSGDDNRAEDGLELRTEFQRETHLHDEEGFLSSFGCSVLEMLIAFARRAEFNAGKSVHFWFWKFLENLGIDKENDASEIPGGRIDRILSDFVWRTYEYDGRGGLFPMNNPQDDQTKLEVWYQFCEYLVDQDWPI